MRSNKRKFRKLFIIFAIIFITSVVLIYETYAWFVGITSVSVDQFTISVAAEGGLQLSLDGTNWSSTSVSINPSTIEDIYIENQTDHNNGVHINKWPTNGLSPVSTNGQLDTTTSKLNLYAKESLAATAGGYQIVSNKLTNSPSEKEGYIKFDLFVKNVESTGTPSTTYDSDTEEDIYLTANSNVYAPTAGANNEGLANSIRVGFFEIGRVPVTASQSTIKGITCSTSPSLCASSADLANKRTYTWNIWEPNAAKHATNLVSYFNQICKKRTDVSVYSADSCFSLKTGSSRNTYALNSATSASNHVDVYDGFDLNTYNSTSQVSEMKTYKTSYATSSGSDKPPLLKIAGNSVTKVRVYIWLEGQDIDNYDLATQDSQLSINFGFTKDRYGLNEANVNNPSSGRASSFEDDSWEQIQANVRAGTTSQYKVGDTREIMMDGHLYTLRLVNKTNTGTICTGGNSYSQTACGFVVEFSKVVETSNTNGLRKQMNSTATSNGGWPGSELYAYLQGEFYNSLPSDLKEVIAPTRVVSGYGSGNSSNFITNDKLYLLNSKEVFDNLYASTSTANSTTRQLDYYSTGLSEKKHPYALNHTSGYYYWLRDPRASSNSSYSIVIESGGQSSYDPNNILSFYPVFRIA